jgi:protein translocase SEC61 complex gamma subunit
MGIIEFIRESRRVMNVATLPKKKEFERIVTVTSIGTVIIGLAGVIIMVVLNMIMK